MSAPNGIELVTLPPPTLAASDSHDKLSPFADPSQALPSSANPSQLGLDSQDLDTLSSEEVGRRLNRLGTRDGEDDAQGLPPVDQGRGAWGFILASFVLETFLWGFSYSFATILVFFESHDPWQKNSLSSLTAIGTVLLAVMYIMPLFILNFYRRYPEWVKPILWGSALINCLGMLVASWATEVWQLILLIGVVGGFSGAFLYAPVLMWLNTWWVQRRGLASGIVFSGMGVGGCACPFILAALLDNYGFPTMCRAWACITGAVFAGSLLFLRPRVPLAKPKGERAPWVTLRDFRFASDPIVLVMTVTSFFNSLGFIPVSLLLPIYASSLSSPGTANILVACYNISGSIGSSLTGYASDASLPWTLAVMGTVAGGLALTAWGFGSTLGAVFAFALLFGAFSQVPSSWGAAARDVAGANPHVSSMCFCWLGMFRGVASIVGPFISTGLYEEDLATDERASWGRFGFRKVIVFVGIMSSLTALGGPGVWWARRWKAQRKAAAA
ncbi:MFS monocarboxylate transporter [Rhodotorula diobovata]|uniref:MFS monocarboxylate transporter n=1 Tax=Rhodotorula diobovata TaxID=5288 RepID=A0A5C5FZL2_9BASI|nr:MFS monocarboxylate transporter [Rhodotorula diobovata]